MKNKLVIPFFLALALIVGCASQSSQPVWHKSGATPRDFEIDRGQCNAQAFSLASGNLYQIAIIQNQCLRGKGWNLVDPNQISNTTNELNVDRERRKKEGEARCANPEFAPIYEKTPCFANNIEFKHMADDTKITPSQKQVFIKWRDAVEVGLQQDRESEIRFNGLQGKKLADYSLTVLKPESDKNNLDLFNGKITWGQYNQKRKENYLKMLDSLR